MTSQQKPQNQFWTKPALTSLSIGDANLKLTKGITATEAFGKDAFGRTIQVGPFS